MPTPVYSTLLSCLHDEPAPVGSLGRGTHYSIFRSAEWMDASLQPLALPEVHDFAVIWDEDHDTRVIPVVEAIYMAGLLSPVLFVGERKGSLTVIVDSILYSDNRSNTETYAEELQQSCDCSVHPDYWAVEVCMFDRTPSSTYQDARALINANEHRVLTYLRNLDSLWSLGAKPYMATTHAQA
jgi:hypothetical protein